MIEFHESMIKHLLVSGNVFKYNWLEFWNEFSDKNMLDVGGEALRREMVKIILPSIYLFQLTEEQMQVLKILRHDMFLDENEEGFTEIIPRNHAERIKMIIERLSARVSCFLFFIDIHIYE